MSLAKERELESRYVMGTFARADVEFVDGHGMYLEDDEGKRYLDFLAGIGVCCLGHSSPVVVDAIERQAERLVHCSNYFYIEHRGEVARRVSELADRGLDAGEALGWKSFFANSGAEANECAMKLVRLQAHRAGSSANTIVCLNGGFHGRTLETVAATMQGWLQDDFRPLPGGFLAVDPGDVDALERVLSCESNGVVAVMVEPIQGESGVHPLGTDYLRAVRDLTREHGASMICDEVQCGVFRAGAPFAFQLAGITPDVFTMAKGIAGGVPMGLCAARPELADTYHPGDHGSTFGGSNLAVACADAVLEELEQGRYEESAERVGTYLMRGLATLPHVTEVRGSGLMVGCDLDGSAPDAHDVVASALEAGLVINATGPHTLRFLPPLICEETDVDVCLDRLGAVLS
ncbi:MAG: aminotransferase class III-fold pyridoxal phosphate-dependent enzyme [Atopobiaceae bacterium]|jgi:acetylornithine aminotransferase|nr:aminotransferase class III-fold pyridoxal phosphate-dependent enzyme [Atopobiaceae bacterium]MCI2173840.1 aminotransferase class III-fold pyridoxal phosphate-dependent enzyme [Atopobiaceae bacterium]MCI2208070.1 aminotransferase class III-fold pyridoxal phosphate-dependent enzyme [Atopobiaceae bacterium]